MYKLLLLIGLSLGWLSPLQAEPAVQEEVQFEWAPEFNVGDAFPEFALRDQNGESQSSKTLQGDNGYLIQFNRSVVW